MSRQIALSFLLGSLPFEPARCKLALYMSAQAQHMSGPELYMSAQALYMSEPALHMSAQGPYMCWRCKSAQMNYIQLIRLAGMIRQTVLLSRAGTAQIHRC